MVHFRRYEKLLKLVILHYMHLIDLAINLDNDGNHTLMLQLLTLDCPIEIFYCSKQYPLLIIEVDLKRMSVSHYKTFGTLSRNKLLTHVMTNCLQGEFSYWIRKLIILKISIFFFFS